MERSQTILLVIAASCLIMALQRIFSSNKSTIDYEDYIKTSMENSPPFKQLKKDTKSEFETAQVLRVTPEVSLAFGFALANVIMIHGPEGCAVVDTTESVEAALAARNAIEKKLGGPCNVTDIVYTHNHADHIQGATVFREWTPKTQKVKVWAHKDLPRELHHSQQVTSAIHYIRAMRQFGVMMPKQHNSGIGPSLQFNAKFTSGYIPPTHFLNDSSADVTLAGVPARLIYAPGETDDQMVIYIPSSRALLCADDIYRAFPNLYTIRGSTFRSHKNWIDSLDMMTKLNAEHLIPSHTIPVSGAAKVESILQAYHDAIKYVHDQTVRYMNLGMGPDQIVHKIGNQLAPNLRDNAYLRPLYGTIEWSVRSLFSGYLGWFSGRPEDLNPLLPTERGRKLVLLGGGPDKVLTEAEDSLAQGEFQWALELATAVKSLESALSSASLAKAKDLRIKAMIQMAFRETSSNGFNYLMTCAYEEMGLVKIKREKKVIVATINKRPIVDLFRVWSLRFRGDVCNKDERIVHFKFTDSKTLVELHIRNGVVMVRLNDSSLKPDVEIQTTETVWREIIVGDRNAVYAITVTGDLRVKPGATALYDVMNCFDRAV